MSLYIGGTLFLVKYDLEFSHYISELIFKFERDDRMLDLGKRKPDRKAREEFPVYAEKFIDVRSRISLYIKCEEPAPVADHDFRNEPAVLIAPAPDHQMVTLIISVIDIVEDTGFSLGESWTQSLERVVTSGFHGELPVGHHSLIAGQKGCVAAPPDSLISGLEIALLKGNHLLSQLLIFLFIIDRICAHQTHPFFRPMPFTVWRALNDLDPVTSSYICFHVSRSVSIAL